MPKAVENADPAIAGGAKNALMKARSSLWPSTCT